MKHRLFFLATFFVVCGLCSQPTITNVAPASGPVGTSVTITGTNFSSTAANNIVYFGTIKAAVISSSSTSLTVTAPVGATYEPVSVTTNSLTAYSTKPFNVTFPGGGAITPTSFVSAGSQGGGVPSNLKTADIDGDGKLDLLEIVNSQVKIYKNTSTLKNISYTLGLTIATTCAYGLTAGDLDGDGKLDIAVTDVCSDLVSIFKNTSTPGSFSFASKIDYSTGDYPYDVAIRDFDLDGKADIAVSNMDGRTVSIFKNTTLFGLLSFNQKIDFAAGADPRRLSVGDFDGDGRPEIILANQLSNSVSVFPNSSINGTISFSPRLDFSTPASPESVAAGDLDGDGKLDMIVTNNGTVGSVSIFKNVSNNGSLGFAPRLDVLTADSTYPYILSVADMDGDNLADLIVKPQYSSVVSLLRNTSTTGSISFARKVDYSIGGPDRQFMTVGDFDGDGKPDMAVGNTPGSNVLFLRNVVDGPNITSFTPIAAPTGTTVTITGTNFTGATSVTFGGTAASSFTVVNSTTITAIVGAGSSGEIAVTTALGIGKLGGFTFTGATKFIPIITNVAPTSGSVGTNVTITGNNFSSTPANNIVYFGAVKALVSAATNTSLTVTVPPGATYEALTVTTNNLTAYAAKPFNITFPGGSPVSSSSFAAKTDLATGGNPYNIAVADFDFDGKPDMAIVNASSNSISIIKNLTINNSISFSAKGDYTAGSSPVDLAMGDLDGDGLIDLAVVNAISNTISVFRNTSTSGTISFASKVDFSTGNSPRGIKIGDLDGDGKPEMIVINYGANTLSIYQNTSSGTGVVSFAAKVDIITNSGPIALSLGDIDGDNRTDIIVANASSNNFSVFRNITTNSTILFAGKVDYATSISPVDVSLGDFDADGLVDVAVMNGGANTVSTFRNTSTNGNISFTPKVDFSVQANSTGIFIADINGDNKLDIAVSNGNISGSVSILQNNSSSAVILFQNEVTFTTGSLPRSIAAADINADGKPDLLATNYNDNTISVLLNQLNSTTLPLHLISFEGRRADKSVQLNWESQNEQNIATFEIENSLDGITFTPVGSLAALGNTNTLTKYSFIHAYPKQQINYYRLRMFDMNNQSTYSSTVRIDLRNVFNALSLYPNPAIDYIILTHPAFNLDSKILILDVEGKVVKEVNVKPQSVQTKVETKNLAAGVYKVIYSDGQTKLNQTLIINKL